MKIIVETSVLLSSCIFWKQNKLLVKHRFFDTCNNLLCFLKDHAESSIITKTIENEANNALDKAVLSTIKESFFNDITRKIKIMTLQHIITNHCLDRLDNCIEECSTRLPINMVERDEVKTKEIIPFLENLVTETVRYIQPRIPRFVKGKEFRAELSEIMVKSLPRRGIIYKGMPADRDLTIMAEATMIYRKNAGKETVFIASMDYHFIPNRIQVGSFRTGHMKKLDEYDSTVRDKLAEKFGFIGETPEKTLEIAKELFQE